MNSESLPAIVVGASGIGSLLVAHALYLWLSRWSAGGAQIIDKVISLRAAGIRSAVSCLKQSFLLAAILAVAVAVSSFATDRVPFWITVVPLGALMAGFLMARGGGAITLSASNRIHQAGKSSPGKERYVAALTAGSVLLMTAGMGQALMAASVGTKELPAIMMVVALNFVVLAPLLRLHYAAPHVTGLGPVSKLLTEFHRVQIVHVLAYVVGLGFLLTRAVDYSWQRPLVAILFPLLAAALYFPILTWRLLKFSGLFDSADWP